MMSMQDEEQLIDAIMITAEIMGNEIKPNVVLVMVSDLNAYHIKDVLQALTRVRRECTGKLTLKMILDILAPSGGWISANEAWAIALPAIDEAASVVWTMEMARAFEVARPILEQGDKIGARMAFIPAYERQVDQAKRENRVPHFELSAGWDVSMREAALSQAVTAGLLPAPPKEDTKALPAPDKPILHDAHVVTYRRYEAGQRFKQLSEQIKAAGNQHFIQREEARRIAVAEHEKRKQELIKQIERGDAA